MKTLKAFLAMALVAFLAVGCGKVEKILPKKDGNWKLTSTETKHYLNSSFATSETETNTGVTYKFDKDGTGVYTDNGDSEVFEWSVNDDNDEITICIDFLGSGTKICGTNTILESEKDHQVWFNTDKEDGDTQWDENTSVLDRIE